jgi:lipid-A-disaccharide synthase
MKYYIIAGEASGDLHGSNLIRAMKAKDPTAEFRCWGGDLMSEAGATIVKHYRELAFMGFIEVITNLRTILKNLEYCKRDILEYAPDAVIFIDYPGFNLRMAGFVKQAGIKTIYYISPQIWAWKESRIHTIKKSVDHMLVILPFEQQFYKKWGMDVDFVGHPLLDAIGQHPWSDHHWRKRHHIPEDKPIIALLPGSRKQEINTMLPIMLEAAKRFTGYHFVIAMAPSQSESLYKEVLKEQDSVSLLSGETYPILSQARAAMVTSGTATLETALFGVPEVVCYKGNTMSYWIARQLVKIKYISLVNLIMDRPVVPELIQKDFDAKNMERHLSSLLYDKDRRSQIVQHYAALHELLAAGGDASAHAARIISLLAASKKTTD